MNVETIKRIKSEKNCITISLGSRLENSQDKNWKYKQIIETYLNE